MSAILWAWAPWILLLAVVGIGAGIFGLIRKKRKKSRPQVADNNVNRKDKKKKKDKNKSQNKSNQKQQTSAQGMVGEQTQEEQKTPAQMKPVTPYVEQSAVDSKQAELERMLKKGLPRFNVNDYELIKNDMDMYKQLYLARAKQEGAVTDEEIATANAQVMKLENYFKEKNAGRCPTDRKIPADYMQKESGCYCFNGSESKNFKEYCEQHPYDKDNDKGERRIVQLVGKNIKFACCVDLNNKEMLDAAMKDLYEVSKKSNENLVMKSITYAGGKLTMSTAKAFDATAKLDNEVTK